MPSLDQRFEKYISSADKTNLHPSLMRVYSSLPEELSDAPHLLFHGPPGCGKYTQALLALKKYSPTGLRYDKIMRAGDDKQPYLIRISDVHFEVDMETLGCHSRTLWNTVYTKIVDSLAARSQPVGYIVCKNFHKTHKELIEIFYYYMSCSAVKLLILSDHVGFLPRKVFERCFRIHVPRPAKTKLKAAKLPFVEVSNLQLRSKAQQACGNRVDSAIDVIASAILEESVPNYIDLRMACYDLLIRQFSIPDCVWKIVQKLEHNGVVNNECYLDLFSVLVRFFRLYNNNYRPIYHLEYLAFSLRKIAHPHRYMLGMGAESSVSSE